MNFTSDYTGNLNEFRNSLLWWDLSLEKKKKKAYFILVDGYRKNKI